jgi:hypothetical protein
MRLHEHPLLGLRRATPHWSEVLPRLRPSTHRHRHGHASTTQAAGLHACHVLCAFGILWVVAYASDRVAVAHRESALSKPYFELTPGQQQTLREHMRTLTLGEKSASVTAHMGSFDREDLLAPKKALEWKCRALVYYVVKVDQSLSNVRDRQVHLVFNREDALVAVLSNVDGIASRGDYSACR